MSVICKKRKVETHLLWNEQILYEITKFIKRLKDFLHLAETCRDFYNWLINNEITLNLIFKNYQFNKLPNVIPNYLLNNLKYLNIEEITEKQLILFKKLEHLSVGEWVSLENSNLEIFTKLKSLNINCPIKNINFELMKENLECLTVIDISYLKDEHIKCLKNLTNLYVNNCENITGDCLQYFPKLKHFIFKTNTPNNITDDKFVNCYNLEYLSCCDKISGKCLEKLTNLKVLDLCYNTIKYYYFENLLQLEELDLSYVSFSDVSKLKLPKSLKKLKIGYTNITDEHLQYLENLTYLNISETECIYGKYFKNFKQLTHLNARKSNISRTVLPENLENLKIGDYDECVITDEYLINLKKLKYLKIESNNNVSDNIFLYLKNIEYLFLDSECKGIKGDNFKELTNLKTLEITGSNVCEENIKDLKTLKSLNVSFHSSFTGQCLLHLKQLTKFSYKDNDTDEMDFKKEDLKELIKSLQSGVSFHTALFGEEESEIEEE